MANELTVGVSLNFKKGKQEINVSLGGRRSDVAGNNALYHFQSIGTSEEAITLGDVAAGGYVLLENLDDTNFIEIRPATGVADLIRLEPGDVALFRLTDDSAPYAIADTADCNLRVVAIDS